jgi:hypothetical protein
MDSRIRDKTEGNFEILLQMREGGGPNNKTRVRRSGWEEGNVEQQQKRRNFAEYNTNCAKRMRKDEATPILVSVLGHCFGRNRWKVIVLAPQPTI